MVQINFAQKQVNAKVVYYGPGMSGKTTNLEVVHQRAPEPNRGDLTSISTDGDRTLFFDFMPLDLGTVAGMRTCFQIYTVPGQVYYNSTRKLVLQGVDGVIFIADSSASMTEENLESMRNLEENLNEYGKSLANLPIVIQYNKRDLPDALPVEELNAQLNRYNAPYFEATASSGQGVFPTLKALAARVLDSIHTSQGAGGGYQPPTAPPVANAATGFHAAPDRMTSAPMGAPGQMPAPAAGQPSFPQQAVPAAQNVPPQMPPNVQPQQPAGGLPPMQSAPMQQQPMQQPAPQQPQVGQTGFHQPMQQQAQQPGQQPAQQMGQTGFHAPQQVGQTGYYQGGAPGGVDPLARTAVHAPPPMQPQQQQPMGAPGLRMAPGAQPEQGGSMPAAAQNQVMQVETPEPAQGRQAPASRTSRSTKREGPRLQPRAAASPTPVRKPRNKKTLLYAGIFLVFALGAGAVVGRFFLKVF